MILEQRLRALSVGQRMAIMLGVLLLPLAAMSAISMIVLNQQEMGYRASVDESIHTLLPLTTLEHYLQRSLVDELETETHESVPDFAALTDNIDRSFSAIQSTGATKDLPRQLIDEAHQAWSQARPAVRKLVEQAHSADLAIDAASQASTQRELQQAIHDVSLARQRLTDIIRSRYARAARQRHQQLISLVWGWALIMVLAALMLTVLLRSLLRPIRQLGRAAARLGNGEAGVRAPVAGNDELTALAERFNDMASLWETRRQHLLSEATQDALTGLLNRRGILDTLDTELAAHQRQHRELSLFMMDLDRFKAINDEYGHSAGDRALIWAAEKMHEALRETDYLGRYGGDEFLAILTTTSHAQAQQIARRLTHTVMQAAASDPRHPGISVGVASTSLSGWEAATLIDAADQALYQTKQRHRQVGANREN
ncbi:diguanylate cyclase [Oleiagrimonas sp. C23AA]|uniref:GGDEF domain-containing protein n=1 Tax=Oleiagrimonas sp. C23AA TaxID=2719047 RepID=UPI00141F5BAA|nr:diguanylate cyclase [Oleiagrimonas sp. C23AA]NII09717.1 diguanylate cyclase [Oleiagrimonas sp. C23AA]